MFERKEISRPYRILLCILLLIVGLVSFIVDFNRINENRDFVSRAEPIQACIDYTTTHISGKRDSTHEDLYVTYNYKGINYNNIYVGFIAKSKNYKKGDIIEVYVNPDNPHEAQIYIEYTISVGIFIIGISFVMIIIEFISYKKEKKVFDNYRPLRY